MSNNSVKATSDNATVSASQTMSHTSFDPKSKTNTLAAVLLIVARSKQIVLSMVRPPTSKISTTQTLARLNHDCMALLPYFGQQIRRFFVRKNAPAREHGVWKCPSLIRNDDKIEFNRSLNANVLNKKKILLIFFSASLPCPTNSVDLTSTVRCRSLDKLMKTFLS